MEVKCPKCRGKGIVALQSEWFVDCKLCEKTGTVEIPDSELVVPKEAERLGRYKGCPHCHLGCNPFLIEDSLIGFIRLSCPRCLKFVGWMRKEFYTEAQHKKAYTQRCPWCAKHLSVRKGKLRWWNGRGFSSEDYRTDRLFKGFCSSFCFSEFAEDLNSCLRRKAKMTAMEKLLDKSLTGFQRKSKRLEPLFLIHFRSECLQRQRLRTLQANERMFQLFERLQNFSLSHWLHGKRRSLREEVIALSELDSSTEVKKSWIHQSRSSRRDMNHHTRQIFEDAEHEVEDEWDKIKSQAKARSPYF